MKPDLISRGRAGVFAGASWCMASYMGSLASSEPQGAFQSFPWMRLVLFYFFLCAGAYCTWQTFYGKSPNQQTADSLSQKAIAANPPISWAYVHPPRAAGLSFAVLMSSVDILAGKMNIHTLAELETMRDLWMQGKNEEALHRLTDIKADKLAWNLLPDATKAAILRFEAGTKLHSPLGLVEAVKIAEEARQLVPQEDDSRLRSVILRQQGRPSEALAILEGKSDVDSLNLKASLLMQLDRHEEAIQILSALAKKG